MYHPNQNTYKIGNKNSLERKTFPKRLTNRAQITKCIGLKRRPYQKGIGFRIIFRCVYWSGHHSWSMFLQSGGYADQISLSGSGGCRTVIMSSIRTPPFCSFAAGLYFPSSARFRLTFRKQQIANNTIIIISTTPPTTAAIIIICSVVNPLFGCVVELVFRSVTVVSSPLLVLVSGVVELLVMMDADSRRYMNYSLPIGLKEKSWKVENLKNKYAQSQH